MDGNVELDCTIWFVRRLATRVAMSLDPSSLCEVRVPTFRRPKLLRRALLSIVAQTYDNWRCVVFDDCPNGSARSVVDSISDKRIGYSHNTKQLGGIGNIDQAFTHRPLFGGQYAFVLEDDNCLLPKHIERSINILQNHNTKVAFCNQFCELIDVAGEPGRIGNVQILNWMYEPGIRNPDELLPALLYSHGFSNGSAFWRTDCVTNFRVGAATKFPEIQESLRLLRLKDVVYVSLEATSVWRPRESQNDSEQRKLTVARLLRALPNRIRKLRADRQVIEYQAALVDRIGLGKVYNFMNSNEIPDSVRFRDARLARTELSLLLCGYNTKLTNRGAAYRYRCLLYGFLLRHLIPSHLTLDS